MTAAHARFPDRAADLVYSHMVLMTEISDNAVNFGHQIRRKLEVRRHIAPVTARSMSRIVGMELDRGVSVKVPADHTQSAKLL
jgi:hypothetical protein